MFFQMQPSEQLFSDYFRLLLQSVQMSTYIYQINHGQVESHINVVFFIWLSWSFDLKEFPVVNCLHNFFLPLVKQPKMRYFLLQPLHYMEAKKVRVNPSHQRKSYREIVNKKSHGQNDFPPESSEQTAVFAVIPIQHSLDVRSGCLIGVACDCTKYQAAIYGFIWDKTHSLA